MSFIDILKRVKEDEILIGYDIITMGSATVDVFAHTDSSQSELLKIHGHKDIAYPLGAKILIKHLDFFIGGGGTNTAVAFSRLGLKTAYLGKIGKDENGLKIFKCLQDEKIHFLGRSLGEISGYSVILDSVKEDRTIFAYKGCNDELSFNNLHIKDIDSKWLYFSTMMKESFKTQEKIAKYAHEKGIKIAFNPSSYQVKQGYAFIKNILSKTEVLIFNKEEAQILLKFKSTRAIDSSDIILMMKKIHKLGPKIIIITDGKNGASCYNSYDGYLYFAKPGNVKVVETTGAGDAFASSFVAGLIYGKNIEFCMKLGMINAESVIKYRGAKNILLHKQEAFLKVEKDKRKIIRTNI